MNMNLVGIFFIVPLFLLVPLCTVMMMFAFLQGGFAIFRRHELVALWQFVYRIYLLWGYLWAVYFVLKLLL